MSSTTADLGEITFSPGAEDWIEYGPPEDRRRVGFHEYSTLYAVPGLYEQVFYERLGMCSADVVVDLYGDALATLGRDAATERVFDFGAGNGMGGERLRALGVGGVVGSDLEPAARAAARRDRPGVYDDYLVTDLATDLDARAALQAQSFTALLAVSAIGVGHIPLEVLADTVEALLEPGGLFGFAVAEELLPDFHAAFFARGPSRVIASVDYVHRRQVDGSDHRATAVVAERLGGPAPVSWPG